MPYVNNQGINIHYQIEGNDSDPPLLLHHGFTQNLTRWQLVGYVEELKSSYQLILVDARGHGESDKPYDSEAYELELRVSDVVAVLDELKLEKVHFWGFSMGGRIGFGIANYAPSRVLSYIIGGSHPYGRKIPVDAPKLDGSDPQAFAEGFFKRIGVDLNSIPEKVKENLFENDFRALAAAIGDYPSLEDILATIDVPCLIYCGGVDRNYSQALQSSEQIPNCSFVTLDGLNHAQAFNQSEHILRHVKNFLEQVA